MKRLFLCFLLLIVNVLTSGITKYQSEDYEKVKKEITKVLSEIVLDDKLTGNITFVINLTINNENKIIVSEVISQSNTLKRNVKTALDNKKLKEGDLIVGKNYEFTMSFKYEE